jgi:heme-degrading monooxygenase HmoA
VIVTVLEARVDPHRAHDLVSAYSAGTAQMPEGLEETFLLRPVGGGDIWQIMTIWRGRAAMEAMRRASATPAGVLFFRAAGAEPLLSTYEVAAHAEGPG